MPATLPAAAPSPRRVPERTSSTAANRSQVRRLAPMVRGRRARRRRRAAKEGGNVEATVPGIGRSAGRSARRVPAVAAMATLVASLALTAVVTVSVHAASRTDARTRFDQSAEQTAVAVQRQVAGYFDELRDIAAFAAAAPDATPAEFREFVEGTGIFEQLPSLVGVIYLHRVEEADVAAFVEARQRAIPGFAVAPIGAHRPGTPHYLLTYYVPGRHTVDLALPIGTDVSAIEAVTDLATASDRSGGGVAASFHRDPLLLDIAAKTRFPLVDQLLALDFFIGVPSQPLPPDDRARRSVAPLGWVAAPVDNFSEVVAAATAGQPEDLGLSLRVDLAGAGMGGRDDLSSVAPHEGTAGPRSEAAYEIERSFVIDGVQWHLAVWSTAGADDIPATVPIALTGGILASLLAASVVYLRLRSREQERALTAELADREHFQRDILDSVTSPMVVLDATGSIMSVNPAWRALRAGWSVGAAEADVGRHYVEVVRPNVRSGAAELAGGIAELLAGGAGGSIETDVAVDERGARRWYAVRSTPLRGRRGGAVVVHLDITERKRSHDELELKATRDDLTGLLNRQAIEAEIDRALVRARVQEAHVALLFIDLDGFKPINDTYGHAVGDDVLRSVAQRITGAVRVTDRVARLGGDEFVVLIGPVDDPAIAEGSAERILEGLRAPMRIGDIDVEVSASIGVATVDAPLGDARATLVGAADAAMYAAKKRGGSTYTSTQA